MGFMCQERYKRFEDVASGRVIAVEEPARDAAANGRRAHRCSVLGWPIDFSRAEALLIASRRPR